MAELRHFDIVVAGGGLAGRIAAAAFGKRGYDVLCCDPRAEKGASGNDNRVTAFLGPSCTVLKDTGLWELIESDATLLSVMCIADIPEDSAASYQLHEFRSDMIDESGFGYAVANRKLQAALGQSLATMPNVVLRMGDSVCSMLPRLSETVVTLGSGTRIYARLVVAADGRESALRSRAEIGVIRFGLGQKAMRFDVTHDRPHDNVTLEIHASGGPFTLVPIADIAGKPASSAVWMESDVRAAQFAAMGNVEFNQAINERTRGLGGKLSLAGQRRLWPVTCQLATRFAADRLALVGEAAHAVPPIGAQGLNMAIADIAALLEIFGNERSLLGAGEALKRYNSARQKQAAARSAGVMALNFASMARPAVIRELRRRGLAALQSAPAVRRGFMRLAMGHEPNSGVLRRV